jgi:RNA polymerase sigma-70 factor (ECF subfamily)
MVLRRCRRLLGDEELAVDAMHDTFVRLVEHRERLHADGLSSLLYRMATNVCLNRLRSRRRRPEVLDADLLLGIAALGDPESETARRSLLDRIFGREPESTRTMAVLLFVDGLTLEEVAAEVGLSVSGVRKRLRVLRERLGESLGPDLAPVG